MRVEMFANIYYSLLLLRGLRGYFEDNLRFLLFSWIEGNKPLNTFPVQFLDCSSLADFIPRYIRLLVPRYFLRRDEKMLNELAQTMNKTMTELLRDTFGSTFGQVFPRCTSMDVTVRDEGIELVKNFLQKYLTEVR